MNDPFNTGNPWELPELTSLNRLPMRSSLFPFPSENAARADAVKGPCGRHPGGAPCNNPWVLPLDGDWKFMLFDNPESVPSDAGSVTLDDLFWPEIRVPGAWSLQGFDRPHYTNVIMPFGNVPPSAPAKNPTGVYRTIFTLPPGWENRRTILKVGSAESFLSVSVNGRTVGYSKDSRLPAEFDCTPFLHTGENQLTLTVIRYSDSSYIEDQDQWWFGGLHRSVVLYSTGPARIGDIFVKTIPADDIASWNLDAVVKLMFSFDPAVSIPEGSAAADYRRLVQSGQDPDLKGEYSVRMTLFDPEGRIAAGFPVTVPVDSYYRRSRWEACISVTVGSPALWSHETPVLYTFAATLLSPGGQELESEACRVGFRSVCVRDRQLLINGKRVMIKGANRHEHDERTGKTISTSAMIRDIELLKRHNFNAVRTSHYPNDERWYDLCDEYGIYLIDEANIECHAYYDHLCRDPRWAHAFLDRGMRMVIRDKNHPSIIIWSLGNESGYAQNQDMMAGWIRGFDSTRPLHYEGVTRPEWGQGNPTSESVKRGHASSDIVSTMYSPVEFLTEWDRTTEDTRPFVMCEYSHAMGNSNGSLADYWKAFRNSRGLQGGFIWEWCDHGILAGENGADTPTLRFPPGPSAPAGIKPWRYGGDFGDEPSDLDFVVDGLVFPDRTLKPAMAECSKLFEPIHVTSLHPESGVVTIENGFDFRSLSGIELTWSVISSNPDSEGKVAEGSLPLPALCPGEKTALYIPFHTVDSVRSAVMESECFLMLEFTLSGTESWAPSGHRLAWEQFPLFSVHRPAIRHAADGAESAPPSVRFSPEGFLASLSGSDANFCELLGSELVPCLFRVPTQNDGLLNFHHLRGKSDFSFYYTNKAMYGWLDAGLDSLSYELTSSNGTMNGSGTGMELKHSIATKTGIAAGAFRQNWSVSDDCLHAVFEFDLERDLPELARVGLSAVIKPGWNRVRWFGRGPLENYSDRQAGAPVGQYSASVRELYVPYIRPQENGNRTGIRWLELQNENGSLVRFESDTLFEFSISPYSDMELMYACHADELPPHDEAAGRGCILHLDIRNRGVGSATCGPDTREEYRVRAGLYRIGFKVLCHNQNYRGTR